MPCVGQLDNLGRRGAFANNELTKYTGSRHECRDLYIRVYTLPPGARRHGSATKSRRPRSHMHIYIYIYIYISWVDATRFYLAAKVVCRDSSKPAVRAEARFYSQNSNYSNVGISSD